MKRVLTLLFIAFLLFFFKEHLRAECSTKGVISYSQNADSYSIYFETLPWNDCAGYGLGWPSPLLISATWRITCEETGESQVFKLDVKDTLKIKVGGELYVTCKVTYNFLEASPKTTSPFPIWIDGTDNVQCFEIVPSDSAGPTSIVQSGPPSPANLYGVQGGVISLQGDGIFVVVDLFTMLPIFATDFQGGLIYDLNFSGGSGFYLCYAVFSSPYEYVEFLIQL